jgi:ASC-1-like (ASCH) protein
MKKHVLRFRSVDRNNFNEIKNGVKTVETRAASARYQDIQKGDELIIVCGKERIAKKVKRARHFKSIGSMFKTIPLKKIMPWVKSVADARSCG